MTKDHLRRAVSAGRGSLTAMALALLVSASSSSSPVRPAQRVADVPTTAGRADSLLWAEMQNVDLHINATAAMHIQSLRGQVITLKAEGPTLDDPTSFKIRVTAGTVVLDGTALSALMNDIVFNYKNAPVRRLRISIEAEKSCSAASCTRASTSRSR